MTNIKISPDCSVNTTVDEFGLYYRAARIEKAIYQQKKKKYCSCHAMKAGKTPKCVSKHLSFKTLSQLRPALFTFLKAYLYVHI